jgi:hypothetical protein
MYIGILLAHPIVHISRIRVNRQYGRRRKEIFYSYTTMDFVLQETYVELTGQAV